MKFTDLTWDTTRVDKDILLDVTACRVSVLVRGRNAWRNTWVRHWFHNSHLFSDLPSAQRGAEPYRERGSHFYVHERPALLFSGLYSRYVVFDGFGVTNREQPFGKFVGVDERLQGTAVGSYCAGIFPGVTMREAAGQLRSQGNWERTVTDNSLRFGSVPSNGDTAPLNGTGFEVRESIPQGSDRYLGWSIEHRRIDTSAVLRHQERWQQMLESLDGVPDAISEARAHGRRSDLQALARLLRLRFKDPDHPARTRADLRSRFEKAIRDAERKVAALEHTFDESCDIEADAETRWLAAHEFAGDPWGSALLREATTAAEVRTARERASNAELLLAQAAAWHSAASDASMVAWQQWQDAKAQLAALQRL